MKRAHILIPMLFLLSLSVLNGQETASAEKKSGIEANILFPIYPGNTLNAKYTRTLWKEGNLKGDLLVGFNIDIPNDRETEGNFSDFSLATGYRQYLYKGLFLEYYQLTGYGRLRNHVTTKKDYDSFDWLVAGTAGYKINFCKAKRLYTILQVGVANVVYKSNPWPIYEDNTLKKEVGETPFFYGGVQIGVNF